MKIWYNHYAEQICWLPRSWTLFYERRHDPPRTRTMHLINHARRVTRRALKPGELNSFVGEEFYVYYDFENPAK